MQLCTCPFKLSPPPHPFPRFPGPASRRLPPRSLRLRRHSSPVTPAARVPQVTHVTPIWTIQEACLEEETPSCPGLSRPTPASANRLDLAKAGPPRPTRVLDIFSDQEGSSARDNGQSACSSRENESGEGVRTDATENHLPSGQELAKARAKHGGSSCVMGREQAPGAGESNNSDTHQESSLRKPGACDITRREGIFPKDFRLKRVVEKFPDKDCSEETEPLMSPYLSHDLCMTPPENQALTVTPQTPLVPEEDTCGSLGSPYGDIFDNAKLFDRGDIVDNAKLFDRGDIVDNAKLFDRGDIFDNAKLFDRGDIVDNAKLFDRGDIFDNAKLFDRGDIVDNAKLFDRGDIVDNAKLFDRGDIVDNAKLFDRGDIVDNAKLFDRGDIVDNAKLFDRGDIVDNATVYVNNGVECNPGDFTGFGHDWFKSEGPQGKDGAISRNGPSLPSLDVVNLFTSDPLIPAHVTNVHNAVPQAGLGSAQAALGCEPKPYHNESAEDACQQLNMLDSLRDDNFDHYDRCNHHYPSWTLDLHSDQQFHPRPATPDPGHVIAELSPQILQTGSLGQDKSPGDPLSDPINCRHELRARSCDLPPLTPFVPLNLSPSGPNHCSIHGESSEAVANALSPPPPPPLVPTPPDIPSLKLSSRKKIRFNFDSSDSKNV
ncbi:hypothetical protein EGW08_010569 [Elysia chlorotica]|uniref:Uncharacterized protein n=1 Tax=Elysia chlorotica TaxID=188477 RepID=A0A3S1HL12_ELYCH|nr:hypothetical protein EGW08_010569 [Elysia chlorotica]